MHEVIMSSFAEAVKDLPQPMSRLKSIMLLNLPIILSGDSF